MGNFIDLTNKKFGKLLALEPTRAGRYFGWLCQCKCGRITKVITSHLLDGHTTTCGHCSRGTHRDTSNPLYWVWHRIVTSKCGCCLKWKQYISFRKWALKNGWQKGLWIHRKADKGIYTPGNCFIAGRRFEALFGKSHHARLLPKDIPLIKDLYAKNLTQKAIGEIFNVSQMTISRIVRGVMWN